MIIRLAAAAAALMLPAAAQAQTSEWYLTATNAENTALIFVDRGTMKVNGNQSSAHVLIVSIDDGNGNDEVISIDMAFDCPKRAWRATSAQMLDSDGKPQGERVNPGPEWTVIESGGFFAGPMDFACGVTKPDPELALGDKSPVRVGIDVLRQHREQNKK